MTAFIGANLTKTYTAAQLLAGDAPGLGDVYADSGGKRYRFVLMDKGAGSVAAVAGKAAYLFGTSAASTGALSTVTMDLTDAVGANAVVAGVFQSAIPDAGYGWVQTFGTCTLDTTLASGADGSALGGPPTAGTDGTLTHCETTSSATAAKPQFGYIIDASAKIVFLRC